MKVSKPMPVSGTHNTRDLGGYLTADGKTTKFHAFLRSDALGKLSEGDKSYLHNYGVRCVIDLRTDMELSHSPCGLIDFRDIAYYNLPLIDNVQSDMVEPADFRNSFPQTMAAMYIQKLDDSQAVMATVFRTMLAHEGCILFNCTAGKDRTGVTAMLLLKLAGVDDEIVIADYAVSGENMKTAFAAQVAFLETQGIVMPPHVMLSKAEDMETTLVHLHQKYGSAAEYLQTIGLSRDEIAALKARLVD